MNVRNLVPWARGAERDHGLPAAQDGGGSPLFTLHREMNRLFDDVFRDFDTPSLAAGSAVWRLS